MPDLKRQLEEQIKRLKQVQERVAEAAAAISKKEAGQSRKSPASSGAPTAPSA